MKTVILCGGKGTRIRGTVADMPKPLLEIAGVPLLRRLMEHFAAHGHTSFVLCLGYRGADIRDYFTNHDVPDDWNIEMIDTGEDAMTGARLWQVRELLGESFFMSYGDCLSDVNIEKLHEFHNQHGKTVTLTSVNPRSAYGLLEISDDGEVLEFREKAVQHQQWINAGFFVMNKKVFDYLDADMQLIFERQPLENLAAASELMAFKHLGFWQSMETYRDWLDLSERFNANS